MRMRKMLGNKNFYKNIIISILLFLCIFINIFSHFILRIEILYSHIFYVPIILASMWWNRKGIIVAIFLTIIYLGIQFFAPLSNSYPYPLDHIIRGLMFCIVSFVIGELSYSRIKAEEKLTDRTKELEKAYAGLKELDKTKSIFISIAAHELRTPLQPIQIYLDLMMRKRLGKFTQEEEKKLAHIDVSLKRLVQIISTLLDLSAIEEGKYKIRLEKVNLKKLILKAINDIRPIIDEKKINLSTNVPSINIFCDPLAIDRVIKNLISNAVKYNKEKGKIEIIAVSKKNHIHVSVKDTGIGIDEKDFDHIFERFYIIDDTLARESDRLGIGLFITKYIIEHHKGKIWVESKKGKGSTFHFTIPTK